MEALALLKFWKWNSAKVAAGTTFTDSAISRPDNHDGDDDDSYFELELSLPPYDSKHSEPSSSPPKKPTLKPQSPISILRSAPPKFGKFKRRRSAKRQQDIGAERVTSFSPSPSPSPSPRRSTSKLFTVRFKIQDGSFVPQLPPTHTPSFSHRRSFDDCCESSKRFSKEVVQKYLNLIKPLYVKSSRTQNSKVKCRQLGKSKSASSTIGAPSPALRNDYCYVDGIEGAILHCKRSLTSSKGNPSLSRCSSDPSHDKSLKVSEKRKRGGKIVLRDLGFKKWCPATVRPSVAVVTVNVRQTNYWKDER